MSSTDPALTVIKDNCSNEMIRRDFDRNTVYIAREGIAWSVGLMGDIDTRLRLTSLLTVS